LVHDLSAMSEPSARRLLESSNESLCVRYLHDRTGEIWFAEDFARARTLGDHLRAGALATALTLPALVQACGGADPSGPSAYDAATPLAHCVPGEASSCVTGSHCVEGCPSNLLPSGVARGGICTGVGRESCGCAANPAPCTTPGLECLLPACCEAEGVCVTPEERTAICAGPDAVRFACK
jgi:hypothetical protein